MVSSLLLILDVYITKVQFLYLLRLPIIMIFIIVILSDNILEILLRKTDSAYRCLIIVIITNFWLKITLHIILIWNIWNSIVDQRWIISFKVSLYWNWSMWFYNIYMRIFLTNIEWSFFIAVNSILIEVNCPNHHILRKLASSLAKDITVSIFIIMNGIFVFKYFMIS